MMDGTLPCYIEYLRFVYNIKRNEEDDYKNLMSCLDILKKDKYKERTGEHEPSFDLIYNKKNIKNI